MLLKKAFYTLIVPLGFIIFSAIFISNAPIHRDDIIWTELSRKVAQLNYDSVYGEIVSTGHLKHSILSPIINMPVNIVESNYIDIVKYVLIVQTVALIFIIFYSINNSKDESHYINTALIILFIFFRPTFLLGHVFKVWQLTYISVNTLAIVMAFKKLSEKCTPKSLYILMGLCGLALHFHLSAFILWPFIWAILDVNKFKRKELYLSFLVYLAVGNVVIFQSLLTSLYCILGIIGLFLKPMINKKRHILFIIVFIAFLSLLIIELIRSNGVSPITASLEQIPASGLFFFNQISYYDFPIRLRWISLEIVLLIFFFLRSICRKEFIKINATLGHKFLSQSILVLSVFSFAAIFYQRNLNPHHWFLIVVVFILYYIAEQTLLLKRGRLIISLSILLSLSFSLILQMELSRSRSSHGYYMTTLGERLSLLKKLCQRDLSTVSVISVPNSEIPWRFLINEDECLKNSNPNAMGSVLIHERLFPWNQHPLKFEDVLEKEYWFSGELWLRNKSLHQRSY